MVLSSGSLPRSTGRPREPSVRGDRSELSRRQWLSAAALASGLIVARGSAASAASPAPSGPAADDVLQQLAEGQRPVVIIVGCADSRVPPELLFDQGVGDLFVVRVAGNVVSGAGPVLKGSVEYAVAEL